MLRWITDVYASFCVKILSLLASNLVFWIRNGAWTKFYDFGYSSISDPQKSRFRLDLSMRNIILGLETSINIIYMPYEPHKTSLEQISKNHVFLTVRHGTIPLILFCSVWVLVFSQSAEIRSGFSTDALRTSSPLPMSHKISFCFAK